MKIYFITGNKFKFEEVKKMLFSVKNLELEQLDLELEEIQEIDPRKVIEHKLKQALEHVKANVMVEDTSLGLECINNLPGPLIKWFLKTVKEEGLFKIAESLGNNKARALAIIGFAKSKKEIDFFEGEVSGTIDSPAGENGFGWDVIFRPEGYSKTFGQMESLEKNKISHRFLAIKKFKEFLVKN
ncbi:RdgB/HAM1 family non-canonical purine NTP pyrophosphatase [Candidatus Daviesbacteria bacterium]|nr:RdgB/HAM1 family non-canonical purine NTP pyrophosphatase [Candidatus Daviesbacteria bacterium]